MNYTKSEKFHQYYFLKILALFEIFDFESFLMLFLILPLLYVVDITKRILRNEHRRFNAVRYTIALILCSLKLTLLSEHYSAQASFLLLFVESGTRKLRKVVESRTKFLFDVKRVLDSTTVLVLDSTPILLL